MSAAIDRIVASAVSRGAVGECADEDAIDSLCLGDWKDAIGAELFRLKSDLEQLAGELEYAGLFTATAKLRAIVKDL